MNKLYELRDRQGCITTFTMTGEEMIAYVNRCLLELLGKNNCYDIQRLDEAKLTLDKTFDYEIKELF